MHPLFLCVYSFLLKESANFVLSYIMFSAQWDCWCEGADLLSFGPYEQWCCSLFLMIDGCWGAGYS